MLYSAYRPTPLGRILLAGDGDRLDRLVGGVMLFSRRRDVTGKLTAAVAEHRVTKEYLAVLRGTPAQDEATLTDLLFRDAAHNKSYVVKRMRKGVRQASLSYTVQGEADGLTLVRVHLHTGLFKKERKSEAKRS